MFTTRATNMTVGGISENNYSDKDDARSRGVSALLDEDSKSNLKMGSMISRSEIDKKYVLAYAFPKGVLS